MKKLKLDIQRFASTNKTTHYELSQYIGSDKPTYLVDYNQDMSKIDAGIYGADAKATINSTNIGDLSELTTTDKLSLVNAINEVNSESSVVGDLQDLTTTNKSSVVGAINEVNGKTNKIGDLTNLTTADKSDLVDAVNEVNGKVGTLSSLTTTNKSDSVSAINEVNGKANTNASAISSLDTRVTQTEADISNFNLSVFNTISKDSISLTNGGTLSRVNMSTATNSDGSLAKIYGEISLSEVGNAGVVSFPTSLRPTETLTINGGCLRIVNGNTIDLVSITIDTNGNVSVPKVWATGTNNSCRFFFINSLLYIKEFGDTPIPEPNE